MAPAATMATVLSGPGTDIDQVIRRCDRVFIMLHDDDDGLLAAAELLERLRQGVVALVQADRRLVQHRAPRQDASRFGTRGGCWAAARKRAGHAVQGEVMQPDVESRNWSRDMIS